MLQTSPIVFSCRKIISVFAVLLITVSHLTGCNGEKTSFHHDIENVWDDRSDINENIDPDVTDIIDEEVIAPEIEQDNNDIGAIEDNEETAVSDTDTDADIETEPSKWPECNPVSGYQTVSIVHVNDIHATYHAAFDGSSKLSRIKGYYFKTRGENPYTIFTDGGDAYEKGSVVEQITQGLSTRLIMEHLGFDIRATGNHDFAWNLQEIIDYTNIPGQISVCSNMDWAGNGNLSWGAVKWYVLKIGCIKIGFFGFTSKPWNEKDQQYDGDFYPGLKADYDYIKIAKNIVSDHRSEVDILIMLSHTGKGDDEEIAKNVNGIDIILGAHSHSQILTKETINGTLIAQAGSNGDFLNRIDIKYNLINKGIEDVNYQLLPTQIQPVDNETETFIENLLDVYAPDRDKSVSFAAGFANEEKISEIAAKASAEVLSAHAGIVEVSTVWSTWTPGGLSPQKFHETFLVEREKPGTLGFNSMTTAQITGSDLLILKNGIDPEKWKLYVSGDIDPQKSYLIAFQKRGANNASEYFGINISGIIEKIEMWQVLDSYGRKRQKDCKYIDSDKKIPLCF